MLSTAVVAALGLARYGVAVTGPVPGGLPAPVLPDLSPAVLRELALPALAVLLVGFSDDVLTARAFPRRGAEIVAGRELLALGVANAGCGLLRGFPVSSSATRTAIAVSAGSRSQVYSLVTAVAVLGVVAFGRPLLALIPSAALGAIVFYAAIRLIDVRAFRRLLAFRRVELAIAVTAAVAVIALNVLYGVVIAVALSVADLLVRVSRPHDAVLGVVPGLAGMHDVDDYPEARTVPGLVIYRYDAPLFSPMPRTSAAGRSPPRTRPLRSGGSC